MFSNRLFSSFATPSFMACYVRSPELLGRRSCVVCSPARRCLPRRGRLGWKLLVCARIAGTEDMLVTHLAKLSNYQTQCLFHLLSRCMARLCQRGRGSKFLCMTFRHSDFIIDDGGSHRSQSFDYYSDYTLLEITSCQSSRTVTQGGSR